MLRWIPCSTWRRTFMGGLGKWVRRRLRLCKSKLGTCPSSLCPLSVLRPLKLRRNGALHLSPCYSDQIMSLAASMELHARLQIGVPPWPFSQPLCPPWQPCLVVFSFLFFPFFLSGSAHMLNVKARTGREVLPFPSGANSL